MDKKEIQKLSKELEYINNSIEIYNNCDIIDNNLEIYLTNRQYEIIKILKDWSFGKNVEII